MGDETLALVFTIEENKTLKPIYYVSKELSGAELNCPPSKKLAYALITTAKKPRLSFQSHHIIVVIVNPLEKSRK